MGLSPRHILIAEDNPVNQKVFHHMLARMGHKVDMVENGEMAVRSALKTPYDLIFMDMMMPVMDGLHATRLIRKSEIGKRRTPIVAVTANVEHSDERACIEAGMDGFISKPFVVEQLDSCLQRYLTPAFQDTKIKGLNRAILNAFIQTMGDNDFDFVFEVLSDLLMEASRTRSDIQRALDQKSGRAVLDAAHSLKAAAAVVGAQYLAEICREMEMAGRENRLDDVTLAMPRFEGAINTARRDIESFSEEVRCRPIAG